MLLARDAEHVRIIQIHARKGAHAVRREEFCLVEHDLEDFFEAFVDSPRGMQEIIQDTSHFVAGGPRSYTTEYIIRGPG